MSGLSVDFLKEHGPAIGAGAAVVIGIAVVGVVFFGGDRQPVKKVPEVMMVRVQPLPPPPPPPPPPKMVEQPKMIEQTPVKMPEPKLDKPLDKPLDRPKADAPPPGPLAMDAKGEGPGDAFNLGGNPGGNGLLGGGGGGSRWGWYAAIVQDQVLAALKANPKTRKLVASGYEVRLWADATGRVERVQMVRSAGDSATDTVLINEIFMGLKLREPPPKDMPMPIVGRGTGRQAG